MTRNEPGEWLARAARRARATVEAGLGGPFGAVVVREGVVLGEGENRVLATNDPTAHAEVVAIRAACANVGDFALRGAEIYTTCEPCPMCLGAIHWARIERIYYACTREDAAAIGFDDAWLYREVALPHDRRAVPIVRVPSCEADALMALWRNKPDKVPY